MPPFPRFEFARNFRTYQARLNEKLAQIKPDIVHTQGATDHAYVALRSSYPTVITVHGIQSEDSKHQGSFHRRARKFIYSRLIERYNLSHTRHLIAISRYVTDYFSKLLRPDAKVYHVPNAVNDSFFELPNVSDGSTVLYAGRIVQRKRPLDLVQAFAKVVQHVPSAQLRLAGEYASEASYVEEVRRFIQMANLGDRVHLLGGLSEGAILREFASCDILALPSAQETTPMVIAQAMAASKPVVATPIGGVIEMVRDGESGFLVKVGDIDGLAGALLRLLGKSTLRRSMGMSGHKFAVENYRAESVARRTYDVYRRIAAVGR
jgi:glycosyltransferase involved in cell wall biosynthesis